MKFIDDFFIYLRSIEIRIGKKREDPEDLMGNFKVTLRAFFATAKKKEHYLCFCLPRPLIITINRFRTTQLGERGY